MKAVNFYDAMPSFPFGNFKDHFVLVFELTSMHDASEKRRYSKLVREPLRVESNSTFVLEHVFELIVLGELMFSIAVDKVCVVGKNT